MSRCFRSMLMPLILALLFGVVPSATLAEGKTQPVHFPSVKGQPVELVGLLRRPGGAGPFPAVVLLDGCGGDWQGMDSRWGTRLVKWGYVTLSVDSYVRWTPIVRHPEPLIKV
jgi:hypothetical protein